MLGPITIGVLIAGVMVSTIFAMGQARARAEADFALAEAQLITDFLENDVLGSAGKANVDEATVSYKQAELLYDEILSRQGKEITRSFLIHQSFF